MISLKMTNNIKKVLEPFLKISAQRIFAERGNDLVFYQDSASSHTAKKIIDFLEKHKVNYIAPAEWMPENSDAAPKDFAFGAF